jgi:MerR family transcriptional regulator, light-induced transcriptional regulator
VSRHVRPVPLSDAEHDLEIVLEVSDAPVYNTAAVARRCQLPAFTFQAWERRYGFPEPRRGPGRQQLYSERDVQALRWLQARIAEGLTIRAELALL